MSKIHLGFRAFDCHELLCHAVAQSAGLYSTRNISVELLDTTFVPDDALPENTFHSSCGAALTSFLTGKKRKVVFVACDKPMFWLYTGTDIATVNDLGQLRVASFPDASPPAHFLRGLLSDNGASCGLLPSRDDIARLGLLTSGSVEASLLSSLRLPHEIERLGVSMLAFVGDKLRLPSAGLAVPDEIYEQEPELVATMVGIFQLAMRAIFDDDELLGSVLRETFLMAEEGLEHAVATVRSCYNPSGFSSDAVQQSAVDFMAGNLGLNSRSAQELYEFTFIKSHQ